MGKERGWRKMKRRGKGKEKKGMGRGEPIRIQNLATSCMYAEMLRGGVVECRGWACPPNAGMFDVCVLFNFITFTITIVKMTHQI